MNKRVLISAVSVLSLAMVIGIAAVGGSKAAEMNLVRADDAIIRKVDFEKSNTTVTINDPFEDEGYGMGDYILSTQTPTGATLSTYISGTGYEYYGNVTMDTAGDNIVTLHCNENSASFFEFDVAFKLFEKALFDDEESYVIFERKGTSKTTYEKIYFSEHNDYYRLTTPEYSTESVAGTYVAIQRIHLEYLC